MGSSAPQRVIFAADEGFICP
jgi:hypothetical protein